MRKLVFRTFDQLRLRLARVLKFGYSKESYYTIQAVNNKGADQTAQMHRLISAFVVRIWHKQVFS